MPDFSALIPETHQNISAGYVETLIQMRREELFTGLMRLSYSSGENLVSTFLQGVQQKHYRCLDGTVEIMPRQTWLDALDRPGASVGFLLLPVEAMRFIRIAYEAPLVQVEKATFPREELVGHAGKWGAGQDPGIVHVQGEKVNKYYLIAGHSTPIIEELSFAEGGARFNISDASFPQTLPKADYNITRYVSDREHGAWREYELRLSFNPLMRMLLTRFSELAGRALAERLCEQLSLWAREGGWNITITSNGIVNRQYFDTLESAIGLYVDLLHRFHYEASPAIGARMADGILREILFKLDPYRRELLTQYIYSQYGVVRAADQVWR